MDTSASARLAHLVLARPRSRGVTARCGLAVAFLALFAGDPIADLLKADEETFAELAARDEPDPWIIAERLAAAGHTDLARKFAAAKPRPAVEGLLAHLERRQPNNDIAAVLEQALVRLEDEQATEAQLKDNLTSLTGALPRAGLMDQARLLSLRGYSHVYLGLVEEGQRDFLRAAKIATQIQWHREAADAYGIASENARVLYDPEQALELGTKSLALRRKLGDKDACFRELMRLVEIESEAGDDEAAIERLQRWAEHLGDPVRVEIANYRIRVTDLDAALAMLAKLPGGRARLLEGDAHRQRGDEERALASYRKAIAAFEAQKDSMRLGHALGNAGISLIRLGRPRDARALLEQAQTQFDKGKDRGRVAMAVLHRGDAHLAAGEAAIALRLFDTARTFAARTRDAWLEGEALLRRGRALLAMNELEPARRAFSGCTTIAAEMSFQEQLAAGALGEARCLYRLKKYVVASGAVARGFEALQPLIEGGPVAPGDEARRIFEELADLGVAIALQQDSNRDLWVALERKRLGIPIDSRKAWLAIRERAVTPAQRAREAVLRQTIRRMELWEPRAREEEDRLRAATFKANREEAEVELRNLITAVQREGRPGALLLYPQPVALVTVRAGLAGRQAVVAITGKTAVVVTPAGTRRADLDSLQLEEALVADLAADVRAQSIVRVPSITEGLAWRRRVRQGKPVVLDRAPTVDTLRRAVAGGALRFLAPRAAAEAAAVHAMRQRVAKGEPIETGGDAKWSWFGVAE